MRAAAWMPSATGAPRLKVVRAITTPSSGCRRSVVLIFPPYACSRLSGHWIDRMPVPCRSSVGRASTRGIKHTAGRERALLARHPTNQRGYLVHLSKAPHRDFREHEVDMLLGHLVEDGGMNRRRGDGIHRNV